ncbi:hypothetical protein OPV22_013596 [Ensete ventricosum]|uniref:Uncharacterized protein n=1 Tax=Ensete ventricosum TaxID=4639 RepID=A0AAV8R8N5_ENSVE|nr:hypothetical protein OPV22_013596 [Ensete ventricosum]
MATADPLVLPRRGGGGMSVLSQADVSGFSPHHSAPHRQWADPDTWTSLRICTTLFFIDSWSFLILPCQSGEGIWV